MSSTSQYELFNPPSDGITRVRFANKSNYLAVSSWDKTVRFYDAVGNSLKQTWETPAAVLDTTYDSDDVQIASGGLARQFIVHNPMNGTQNVIGTHESTISCVEHSATIGCYITGSWDSCISVWDCRAAQPRVAHARPGKKVFAMATSKDYIVVGTSERKVFIYDFRNIDKPLQDRESSLKHQTRDIKVNTEHTGYLLTSVEGRVAVEYFNPSEQWQEQKFAFKCHRFLDKETQSQTVFPVNCAAYHPIFGTFVTGGCDGLVNVWDGNNKKRICQFPQFPTSIASLDFNLDGRLLAIAVSYTWEQGEKMDAPQDQICIRNIREFEVQPKKKK